MVLISAASWISLPLFSSFSLSISLYPFASVHIVMLISVSQTSNTHVKTPNIECRILAASLDRNAWCFIDCLQKISFKCQHCKQYINKIVLLPLSLRNRFSLTLIDRLLLYLSKYEYKYKYTLHLYKCNAKPSLCRLWVAFLCFTQSLVAKCVLCISSLFGFEICAQSCLLLAVLPFHWKKKKHWEMHADEH